MWCFHGNMQGRCIQRYWGVLLQDLQYDMRLEIMFYHDNMKDSKPAKSFKMDPSADAVTTTLLITKMVEGPDKYANGMTLKCKDKSIMCCYDSKWAL